MRSHAVTAEQELTLLLSGTAARRRGQQHRIEALVKQVDLDLLWALLGRFGLVLLGFSRLIETVPDSVPGQLRSRFAELTAPASRRGLILEALALQFQADLEREGVAALPLKGPVLSRDLYGDPGLRSAVDLDLLVPSEQLDLAVRTIAARGFSLQPDPFQTNGLPLLHYLLTHDAGQLLPVELHWRIHWYETRFSRDMLDRSLDTPEGRRARPDDELASLLLFYARDGYLGLRLAADIAAWWDRHGHEVTPPVLDDMAADYPQLRDALRAAGRLLEDLVGIPRGALLSDSSPSSWRQRTALRLANWEGVGNPHQVRANVTFVDWLVAPRGGWLQFVRRALIPPQAKLEGMYGLAEDARWRRLWWRLVHGPKLVLRYLIALWRVRRGRQWVPLPQSLQHTGSSPSSEPHASPGAGPKRVGSPCN
jgi:hypothetical protein